MAMQVDYLALIWWSKTEAAKSNTDRPESAYALLMGEKKESDVAAFDTPEAFEAARARIIGV